MTDVANKGSKPFFLLSQKKYCGGWVGGRIGNMRKGVNVIPRTANINQKKIFVNSGFFSIKYNWISFQYKQ